MVNQFKSEYHRSAYGLLASNATWRDDCAVLIFSGIVLHLVTYLLLLKQSPAASSLTESICFILSSGRPLRHAQPHTYSELSTNSASSSSSDSDA
jgi:hypothetical protein